MKEDIFVALFLNSDVVVLASFSVITSLPMSNVGFDTSVSMSNVGFETSVSISNVGFETSVAISNVGFETSVSVVAWETFWEDKEPSLGTASDPSFGPTSMSEK